VTTLSDPHHTNTVARFIKNLPVKVFPVGRLDKDAFGLLLLTNDGELSEKLSHPRFEIPRVYIAEVKGKLTSASCEKAKEGFFLEDGFVKAGLKRDYSDKLTEVLFPKVSKEGSLVKITICEGRKHLVKRLLSALGNPVINLSRVSHGKYSLEKLKPGQIQEQEFLK